MKIRKIGPGAFQEAPTDSQIFLGSYGLSKTFRDSWGVPRAFEGSHGLQWVFPKTPPEGPPERLKRWKDEKLESLQDGKMKSLLPGCSWRAPRTPSGSYQGLSGTLKGSQGFPVSPIGRQKVPGAPRAAEKVGKMKT